MGPYLPKDLKRIKASIEKTLVKGKSISPVFAEGSPYHRFAIMVKNQKIDGEIYLLQATLNGEKLEPLLTSPSKFESNLDLFIVDQEGKLQTPSFNFGKVLDRIPFKVPNLLQEQKTSKIERGKHIGAGRILSYSAINDSPFTLVILGIGSSVGRDWLRLELRLKWFFNFGLFAIIIFVMVGSYFVTRRIKLAERSRLDILHKVEYTDKMASIGRLAAGVAHEINNPLAIINENAGLMQDMIAIKKDQVDHQKLLSITDVIIGSIERCSSITRRLLGFAKQMDIVSESINMEGLLKEVLGFLEKEARNRSLQVNLIGGDKIPPIESDRGRLQQVFLNLLNNAFAAVENEGQIDITFGQKVEYVTVRIRDNGEGIPPHCLNNVFDPFYSTKGQDNEGLGLSITYGIVEKLGGHISVNSKEGEWTVFTVQLPLKQPTRGEIYESQENHPS